MRARWSHRRSIPGPALLGAVLGTLLVAVLALGACAAHTAAPPPGSVAPPATGAPAAVSIPLTPPPTAPDGQRRITPFWMRSCPPPETATDIGGCRVAPGEVRLVPADNAPKAAVDALMAGPNAAEKQAGESSNIRGNVTLYEVTVDDGTATVSFNRYFETAKTLPQAAQVVFTLTQLPEITSVRFLVDRQPNGAIGVGGLDRSSFPGLTPTVLLDTPTLNATVPASFKLTGTAVAPGRTFPYRVLGADDAPLVTGEVTILANPGTRGPFIEPVRLPAGTSGPVVIVTGPPDAEVHTPILVG